jgi:hypothetical protein
MNEALHKKNPREHRCPVTDCPAMIPLNRAMCASHWHVCPDSFKVAIIRLYRDAPGSAGHLAAISAGVKAVEGDSRRTAGGPPALPVHRCQFSMETGKRCGAVAIWKHDVSGQRSVYFCDEHKPELELAGFGGCWEKL